MIRSLQALQQTSAKEDNAKINWTAMRGPYLLRYAPNKGSTQPAYPRSLNSLYLSAWRNFPSMAIQNALREDSDQTAQIQWLAGRTCTQSEHSSLSTWRNRIASMAIQSALRNGSDQTARMCRTIWIFSGRTSDVVAQLHVHCDST